MANQHSKRSPWLAAVVAGLVVSAPLSLAQDLPQAAPSAGDAAPPLDDAATPGLVDPDGDKLSLDEPGQERAPNAAKPLPAPDSPEAAREVTMRAMYNALANARSTEQANQVAAAIERIWLDAGSDTISVLMERSLQSANGGNTDLAIQLLDTIVDLAPDYAEGWNRRAYVLFLADQPVRALGDLRRALALEPKHFRALDGMAKILASQGEKKAALMTLEKLREINPKAENLEQSIEDLKREVEGQGI